VISSPRFWVRDIQTSTVLRSNALPAGTVPTPGSASVHVQRDEILALAGVDLGDRLLAVDTDVVAARVAAHTWVAGVRVRRRLPSVLNIEVTERVAVAAVALGGLYLVDETGRPFKRATMEEADGLPVISGVDRVKYVDMREVTEAALREALAIVAAWRERPGRPALSEINIDPRFGFALFLLEGGAEIRLGRGDTIKKLASFDQIFEAVKRSASSDVRAVRIVHLDGANGNRIPVRFAEAEEGRSAGGDGESPRPKE
jgi:cell division septal protein FtsQ